MNEEICEDKQVLCSLVELNANETSLSCLSPLMTFFWPKFS